MPLPLLGAGAIVAALRAMFLGLIAAIIAHLPAIIAKVLAGLGLYFLVAEPIADEVQGYVQGKFTGVPGYALETLFYLNMDDYVTAIISAHVIAASGRLMLRRRATSP